MSKTYEPTIMEGAKQKYAFSVEKISQIYDGSKKFIKIILAIACDLQTLSFVNTCVVVLRLLIFIPVVYYHGVLGVLLLIVAMTMLVRNLKHRHSGKSDDGDGVSGECSRWINNPNISPSPQSGNDCSFDDIPNCTCDDGDVPSSQCCEEVEEHKACLCYYKDFRYGLTKIRACNIKVDFACVLLD